MGAWGPGNFQNDSVLDWLAELERPGAVREALASVAEGRGYLEVDDCCAALGAAEVVAACGGQPGEDLPKAVSAFAAAHGAALAGERKALKELALAAVRRVEAGSELQELFQESDADASWHATVKELLGRLERIAAG